MGEKIVGKTTHTKLNNIEIKQFQNVSAVKLI